jgi:hypothetical protein
MDHAFKCAMQEQVKTAVLEGKWKQLRFLGNRFERAGCYTESWNVLAQMVEKTATLTLPIWPGPEAISTGVLVLPRSRDLGDELRILRYLGNLQAHTNRVTALVEPRLAPLLERSFPGLVCSDPAQAPPLHGITHMAAQERLALWFGADATQIKADFRPLIPPGEPQQNLRGIGISWFSRSKNKSFPSIEDWSVLLQNVRQPIRSLQYMEKHARIRQLQELSGQRIQSSRPIDQLNDLDGFAEQVSQVRGVLTISNTTAHMAGVLGVPCVVILDNGSITNWPDVGDQSPLYPHTQLIRRGNDTWAATLKRGWAALKPMLKKR